MPTSSNKRVCGKEGVRGLHNLGQTCYMNVIIQSLLHDPILTSYFLGNGHAGHDCEIENCIACAMTEAFSECWNTDKQEGYGLVNLLMSSWKLNQVRKHISLCSNLQADLPSQNLAGYQQQDAHEYYQSLVDQLHISTGNVPYHDEECQCFFHRVFFGKLRSTVTCNGCRVVSKTDDPIVDLSLDFEDDRKKSISGPQSTSGLEGCLKIYTSPEELRSRAYRCHGCGDVGGSTTKQFRIRKLPAIMCMQLKRFEPNRGTFGKKEGKIDFPLVLNMAPYTTKPESRHHKQFMYDLTSVIVHTGSLNSGHYYAYCRHGEEWFLFNDDKVTVTTERDVLSADAYLLFYSLHILGPQRQKAQQETNGVHHHERGGSP